MFRNQPKSRRPQQQQPIPRPLRLQHRPRNRSSSQSVEDLNRPRLQGRPPPPPQRLRKERKNNTAHTSDRSGSTDCSIDRSINRLTLYVFVRCVYVYIIFLSLSCLSPPLQRSNVMCLQLFVLLSKHTSLLFVRARLVSLARSSDGMCKRNSEVVTTANSTPQVQDVDFDGSTLHSFRAPGPKQASMSTEFDTNCMYHRSNRGGGRDDGKKRIKKKQTNNRASFRSNNNESNRR